MSYGIELRQFNVKIDQKLVSAFADHCADEHKSKRAVLEEILTAALGLEAS